MERHFFMINRALNARKRKIFALFFALAAVVTSAMAQEESLLTTLTFGGSETYGETTSGVVNVTATNVGSYNGTYGWLLDEGGSLSVTAKEGYTITKCVFRQNAKAPITDTEAPFEIHANGWGTIIEDPEWDMNGVTSIEVYGYANAGGGSATTYVTITQNDFPGMDVSFTKDGVTVSADWIDNMDSGNLVAPGSFSTTLGNFTKIEVNAGEIGSLGEGWSGNPERQTWTGNASSVSFSGDIMGLGHGITIMFTIEAATPAPDPTEGIVVPEGGEIFVLTDSIMTREEGEFMFAYDGEGWGTECQYMIWHTQTMNAESRWNRTTMNMVGTDGPEFGSNKANVVRLEINFASTTGGGALAEGWSLSGNKYIWTGSSKSVRFYHTGATISGITSVVYVFDGKCHRDPQRFTDTVKVEDLVVGDTLAMGAKMNSDQYFLFWCAPNRARRHGNLWTSDFESFFLGSADAISKHGAIDLENPDGLRGCLEPVNENGELAEEWIVTSTNPFTIAGIGKAEITNHSYRSEVDYAALEPGDTITFGATILNTPEKVWFLANRMQRIFSSGEISIIDDDRWSNSYGTIGKNGVIKADNYGTTQVPINEQGTLGGKWVVVFYSPLTIAGIGYPMPTLTLSDKVSIIGMPVAGIKDIGNDNYEVEPGTQFQIQAAVPEHYSLVGWSDLASTDPNYTANPRTITINSDSTIQPIYAIDTYTLTLGVNDESRGSVKIGPGVKKSVWDKEFLKNMYIWVQMMPSSAPHVEHNNNEKDNIRIEGQPMQTEVMWYYTTYFDPKGSSYIYMYEAGKAQFLFGFINGHHTFQRIEIYSTEGSNQYDGGWEYNTEKGCYQTTATEPFDMASLVLAEGQGVYLPVDSVIFYVPSELPEGVVPTETPGVYTVDYGTELSFVATPASEDYYLAKWNDEPATSDTLKLTMTEALAVNANFAHVPYIYTLPEGVSIVEPMPAGITAKGEGVYEIVEGTEFQISADIIPEHYHFGHWADLNSEDEQYAANPRTIVAGENLTIEPIFAIDTYTLTLATNDSTKGIVSVIGAGSGAGASVGEMISLSEKQTENPVMGEYFQVAGEGVNYEGRIIGRSDDYQLTISSQNGEKLDFIILKVSSKGLWSGYTVSSTAGDVEDLLDKFTIRVSNINATSVTISRSGTTGNPQGYIIVSSVHVNEEIPLSVDITDRDFPNSGNVLTGNGVTLTAGSFDLVTPQIVGGGTFTTDLGNFTKIEIYAMGFSEFSGEGWTEEGNYARVWTGKASSVSFGGAVIGEDMGSIYISYTIAPASAASGIVDNGDGTYTVDYGTELTFVAKPVEGFMLESWSNGAPVTGDTLKLTMTEELSLTANFKHIPATITLPEGVNIVKPMPAGITSKGEGVYEVEYGTEFQISADSIPEHYHFGHWADLDTEDAMYAANPRTIVASENLTVEPIFAIDTYTLTLATNDSTKGVVSLEGAGQGGEPEPSAQLIVPESWSSEVGVTITAADLPGFVASTEEAVKALPVPTEGSVFVIYNFKDDGGVEAVTFENGEYVRTTSTPVDHANTSYYSNQGMIFLYTTAAGQAGQGGEGEEPEGEPVSVTIGDLTTAQVSDYLPACTMTNYAYSQQIYMANEIGGAGKITAITYWLMNNSNYTRNYEIYMKEVSESAFASNDAWVLLAESDKVASYALANDTDEPVAKTITLNAPFEYSGNGNLMIAIRDITGQWSDGAKGLVNDVNGNKTLYSFRDSKAYDVADPGGTGLLYAKRNVVKIDMIAAPAASGIVDNGDGTYTVDWGTELTFVAQPAEGFMLDSWSNGAPVTGDTLKLTMTEELSLTANFKYIPAVITLPEGVNIVEPLPAGITALGEGVYEVEHGTEFQISADGAPEHYHFDHWTDLDSTSTEYYANPRTVVADTNFTANPFYTIDTYVITLASNDTTMGTLSVAGAGAGGASNWEIVELTNVPAEWNGDYETLLSADYLPGFKEITEAEALTWTSEYTNSVILFYGFTEEGRTKYVMYEEGEQQKGTSYSYLGYVGGYEHVFYTTGSDEPATGKIVDNGNGTYTVDWGTEIAIVATPAEDYHLVSWSNGAAVTEDNKQNVTVTGELNITAQFKHDTYMLTVEGAEVEVAKFEDGNANAVVLNPGRLVGVQEGDSVMLTTTATFSTAAVGNNLDITLHYAIEVIDGGIYENEYALAVTDSLYSKKGFIIESMIPDSTAAPAEEETEVKEGIEVYGYGYCADGNLTGMLYHLKRGNPNQYKVEFEDARFDDVDWTDLDEKGPEGVIYVTVPVDVPTGDYKMTVTFRDHTEYYSLESEPITITFHVNLPETYVVALFDNVIAVVDTCECLTDIQWYWRADATRPWTLIEGATGYYYKQEGGLSGEYFIKAKMNGVDTYTCPQDDMSLYGDNAKAKVRAYPNPVVNTTTVIIENSTNYEHQLRITNIMGGELLKTTFEGSETVVDMDAYSQGNYMISVDGIVVKVMKK